MITRDAIEAANDLREFLPGWCATDEALERLAARVPGFDPSACLLKVVAVNSLYATQVFAIWRMALHVQGLLAGVDPEDVTAELVERIAALPKVEDGGVERHFRSFASKFAHFFLDSERFPIKDSFAERAMRSHLGSGKRSGETSPYPVFVRDFVTLRHEAGLDDVSTREIDRYLWLAGQFAAWRRNPGTQLNGEVRGLFEQPSAAARGALARLAEAVG